MSSFMEAYVRFERRPIFRFSLKIECSFPLLWIQKTDPYHRGVRFKTCYTFLQCVWSSHPTRLPSEQHFCHDSCGVLPAIPAQFPFDDITGWSCSACGMCGARSFLHPDLPLSSTASLPRGPLLLASTFILTEVPTRVTLAFQVSDARQNK